MHIDYSEMNEVLEILYNSLKQGGVILISLKKGDFEGMRGDRYFCDYSIEKFNKLRYKEIGFELHKVSESRDRRIGREDEYWLNIVLKKNKPVSPISL